METVTVKKLTDCIYLMRDDLGATGYVVLGTKKAVVIDTMDGTEDMKKVVETITDLPIMLVNTHGHPDHIGGNLFFEEAYLHPADVEIGNQFMEYMIEEMDSLKQVADRKPNWKPILPGDRIDLGDRELEVFDIAGHTKGSIGLLDRKNRVFFTGDAINDHLWMQLDGCLSFPEYLNTLVQLESIRSEFDYILTGHGLDLIDASLFEELEEAVREIIRGENEDDFDYEYFDGVVKAHPYGSKSEPKLVVYDPKRM